jgi:signal transduction histidine kinase
MRKLVLSLIFVFVSCQLFPKDKVDSLLQLIDKSSDIQKTDIYLQLSKLTVKDSAKSNSYNKKAYQLALANNQILEQAKSVYQSGKIQFTARNFSEAIGFYEKALPLYRMVNDTTSMTTCYSYIGISYFNLSKSEEAIASYLEGLKLSKNDPDYSAELLANIGLVHDVMDNFSEAIQYYKKAVKLNQQIGDSVSLAIDYDYLGISYSRLNVPDSSLVYYNKALSLFKKIGKIDRYAVSLSNIAWVFQNYPDSLNKAISYSNLAWKTFRDIGWLHYEADIKHGIATAYLKQGKYDQAVEMYKNSLQLAIHHKRELLLIKQIYQGLSQAYEKKGNYKEALANHILFSQYNDSTIEEHKLTQIAKLEKQYETEKKEKEILQLQTKHQLAEIELKKNRQIKILGAVLVGLLMLFLLFLYSKYIDKKKSNDLLEIKNKQIEKSEHDLQILNAAKNKFFSIIAHDLKNPFHTVMGYSNLLNHDYERFTEEERRKFASDINQSSNNIFRLLQNLLEWSRSQTGRINYAPRLIEFKRILDNSMSVLHAMAGQKNVKIENHFDQNLEIFADPTMIETVLRNLISNAIKFTPENGNIKIFANKTNEVITVNIEDSGIGISEIDIANLFRIDSKVKRKGTNNEDGTGLGLVLCREFIQKHNGSIWANSKPGSGSKFSFTLPCNEQ